LALGLTLEICVRLVGEGSGVDDRPVTRYAKTPDGVNIAYQSFGEGPLDLLVLQSATSPMDLLWEEPGLVRVRRRLTSFSRNIWMDNGGWGASQRDALPERFLDESVYAETIAAVVEATGCERFALLGGSFIGAAAIRYAADHPEQVSALVLLGTYASYIRDEECPWGLPAATLNRLVSAAGEVWGTGAIAELVAPSRAGDDGFRDWMSRGERLGSSPQYAAERIRSRFEQDVRCVLPDLHVRTIVIHRRDDRLIRVNAGRYLAEHIQGAKYVELPGEDNYFFVGDTDALLDEIEEFLTGSRQAPEGDVVTATILFTDIVASTEQSARMGHRKWTALTDAHDTMVRATLKKYRGREIKTIGDGFLATFDATTRAVRAATEVVNAAKGMELEVRAGVHVGEVEVRPDDVVGLTVSIAKRICDLAGPGEVFVSEVVKGHLAGSGIALSGHGIHVLKGVPDEWRLFAVVTASA
jgi:class 3 adenylate cyclase/pimeloyl-ACP methyl ester carboxylesterase